MIQAFAQNHDHVLGFRFVGPVQAGDYRDLVPLVDAAIARHGRVRLLLQFYRGQAPDPTAVWRDLRFTATHFHDIERLAIVGDSLRDALFARLSGPFTVAAVRHFTPANLAAAWIWLEDESARRPPLEADPEPAYATPQPAASFCRAPR